MSNRASITATLGLDTAGFNNSLKQSMVVANQAHGGMAGAAGKNSRAHEGLLKSGSKVTSSMANLASGLGGLQSGGNAAASAAESLSSALRLPLGVGIGLGLAVAGYMSVKEAINKTAEASEKARALMSDPVADVAAQGPEAVQERIKSLREEQKVLRENRGYASFLFGRSNVEAGLKREVQIINYIAELGGKVAQNIRDETAARALATATSERDLALMEARLETEKKLVAIHANRKNVDPRQTVAQKEQAQTEGDTKASQINEKFDAQKRAIDLESELLYIKRKGYDVDVRSAQARLAALQEELALSKTDEAKAAAKLKVQAAKDTLAETQKTTAEARQQLAIEKQVADMIAPSDAKRRAELILQNEALENQLAEAKDDEAPAIELKLSKNSGELRELDKTAEAKRYQIELDNITAKEGRGEAEHQKALDARLRALGRNLAALELIGGEDAAQRAAAQAAAAGMRQELAEIHESRLKGLGAVMGENAVLELQAKHHNATAALLKIRLDFAEKIAAAQRNGNPALVKDLKAQEKLALNKEAKNGDDASKRTLGEIAQWGKGEDKKTARAAFKEEQLAQKERRKGNADGFKSHMAKAEELKSSLTNLKDSEKGDPAALQAMKDSKDVLEKIEAHTRGIGKNQ